PSGTLVVLDPGLGRFWRHDRDAPVARRDGAVSYEGHRAVAVAGLPTGRPLPVVATPMPEDGEFAGRWRAVDVVVSAAEAVRWSDAGLVSVEHGQLMACDLDAFADFRMWESLDGLADFVFWGPDAADLAPSVDAAPLAGGEFGWVDVPMADVGAP